MRLGLTVSAIVSRSSGAGSSAVRERCVVFFSKTLYCHVQCDSSPRGINRHSELNAGLSLVIVNFQTSCLSWFV